MFCKNCGREIPDDAKLCASCGAPVPADDIQADGQMPDVLAAAFEMVDAEQKALWGDLDAPEETQSVEEPAPEVTERPPAPGRKKGLSRGIVLLGVVLLMMLVLVVVLIKVVPSGGGKNAVVYMNSDYDLMYLSELKPDTSPALLSDLSAFNVSVTADGKTVYYTRGDTFYRVDLTRSDGKYAPEEITDGVIDFQVLKNGGALYLKGSIIDNQLFWFDGWDSYVLAEDVNQGFSTNEAETYVYYTIYDGYSTYYRVPLAADGESEFLISGNFFTEYGDDDLLVYAKLDDELTSVSGIYSLVPGSEEVLLEDVSYILHAEAGENETVVIGLIDHSSSQDIVQYVNGERSVLLSDIILVGGTFEDDISIYIYLRSDDNDGFELFQNVNGVESRLDLGEGDPYVYTAVCVLNDSEAVLWRRGEDRLAVTSFTIEDSQLKNPSVITHDCYGYAFGGTYKGKNALYYYEFERANTVQPQGGDLFCYCDGEKMMIAEDAVYVTVLPDSGTVFEFSDFYSNPRLTVSGSLSIVEDGNSTLIAEDVSSQDVVYLSGKQVLYLKDEDLYLWNGKDSEMLASGVKNFRVPESACADSRTYYTEDYYFYY